MNEPKTIIEPLAGYIFDLVAKIRNKPFVPHSLTKLHNLKFCRDITKADTVVEIGSFKGVTARRLSYLFEKVITVEIDTTLHEISKIRCATRDNVQLILGDGKEVLADLAPDVRNAVLFLDGHFSGGQTGRGDEVEPVLEELDVISLHIGNFCAILIDDFRLFGVEEGWPRKSAVLAKLEEVLPNPVWTHYILNDQFICIRSNNA